MQPYHSSATVQFADDVTQSEADKSEQNVMIVINRLTESFQLTRTFCEQHELIINTAKTQFIIFKSPSRQLANDLVITLDDCSITPSESVKLLGVTLDRHFTFGAL